MLNTLRNILVAVAMAAALGSTATAQNYPDKPIRLILPNTPGSSPDTVARIWAPVVSKTLGQPIVFEYKAGAGTLLGVEYVAKNVPADGYTVLFSQVHDK